MRKQLLMVVIVLMMSIKGYSINPERYNILVFSKTQGFRHDCIPQAKEALDGIASKNAWGSIFTEDSLMINPEILETINVVIFLQTTGDILGENQRDALMNFIEGGGGLVTIHSGTITENNWPWFADAIGAKFTGHPPTQKGKLIIEDRNHPATSFFNDSIWVIEDEWYSFDRNPRGEVSVLISIDESSYNVDDNQWFEGANQRMGDHPLVWYKHVGHGKVFQTALGHEPELYTHPLFIQHIEGAIHWAGK